MAIPPIVFVFLAQAYLLAASTYNSLLREMVHNCSFRKRCISDMYLIDIVAISLFLSVLRQLYSYLLQRR